MSKTNIDVVETSPIRPAGTFPLRGKVETNQTAFTYAAFLRSRRVTSLSFHASGPPIASDSRRERL